MYKTDGQNKSSVRYTNRCENS